MTQEDKQLLLKDLCARLPYRVKYQDRVEGGIHILSLGVIHHYERFIPYLRPMLSMIDEEKEEFEKVMRSCTEKILACPTNEMWYQFFDAEEQDFMNTHHFDYRGLIPMGLALEAPEGMYE